MLLQSRGFNIQVGGPGHGAVLPPNPLRPDIRGAFLPPLLGVPASVTTADQLAAQAQALIAMAPAGVQPAEWLQHDSHHVAAICARLTLNRSSLRAVFHSRNPDPRPELRRCPHCGPNAPAETVVHALAECPAYAPQRAMLKQRLAAALQRIRSSQAALPPRRRALDPSSEVDVLLHACLATPPAPQAQPSARLRKWLCLRTGDFLSDIDRLRPSV